MYSSLGHNSHKIVKIIAGTAGIGAIGGIGYLSYIANHNKYSKINHNHIVDFDSDIFSLRTKQRLHDTFTSIGQGVAVTAISATAIFRSQGFQNKLLPLVERHPIMAFCGLLGCTAVTMFGTLMTDKKNVIQKQAFYMAFCSSIGLSLAPIGIIGGPIIMRAAAYTGALTSGLVFVSANSPSKQFLSWAAPLSAGLSVVAAASVATIFFPVTGAAFTALHSISLYGGLVVFTGLVMVDTQKIIKDAEELDDSIYDPINAGLSLYLDSINLFIRIVEILAKSQAKKNK